tara:strand:- start:2544 stop:2954 length:411 start_codon:yes stop_codon:yes gene_type:complete
MNDGIILHATSVPNLNPNYEMIDAQLTTEIFGFFTPTKTEIAINLAYLPIRTTARENAAWISEFNIIMYSSASTNSEHKTRKEKVKWMAKQARLHSPNNSYSAKIFDFMLEHYNQKTPWEEIRDALHEKYQIHQED